VTREPDDDAVGRLFALPLEHFVPERDALAKALRAGGRREEAAAVKALAKPSLPAWALNQLAHGRPEEVGAFLAATERLEAAQGELLAGGDREAWRAAAAELAAATERLLALARGLSDDRSRPLSAATLDRVRATLQAMGSDPEARELLRRGRLDREREPGELGAAFLAGGAPAPARAPGRRGGKRGAKAGRAAGGKAERGSAAEAERRAAA